MDIQFTSKSQEALGAAVRSAATRGNPQVEPIHLLNAIVLLEPGIASALLETVGADFDGLRRDTASAVEALPTAQGNSVAQPTLNQTALKVLNAAQSLAKERGDEYVSTEHLLIGLAQEGGEPVTRMLEIGRAHV